MSAFTDADIERFIQVFFPQFEMLIMLLEAHFKRTSSCFIFHVFYELGCTDYGIGNISRRNITAILVEIEFAL